MMKRALVAGFLSTVGDIECLQIVEQWLNTAGIPYDITPYSQGVRNAMPGTLDPTKADPKSYSHLIVVCGPCSRELLKEQKLDLSRFQHCTKIGVNLSMIASTDEWNPFDILIERDSDRITRPDLTFLKDTPIIPVVGRCLIGKQNEYGSLQRHDIAERAINGLIERQSYAVVNVDTRWCNPKNTTGMKSSSDVISVLKRLDLLLTTRLHGLVFGLKAGIPVIAIDPISGGGKVTAQAKAIGWPIIIQAEEAIPEQMDEAAEWCLSGKAQETISACKERILPALKAAEKEFFTALSDKSKHQDTTPDTKSPNPFTRLFKR